ncbi:MAG: ArgE/DapE family deacylase [Nitrososphaerota archaeon]|nr:ArgE/DapE family deacylase [Nitrososphaerota archaeon]
MERDRGKNGLVIQKAVEVIEKNQTEMIAFLSKYVQQKSVNASIDKRYGEGPCQEWLARELEGWGCFDKVDLWEKAEERPNIVSVLKGKDEGHSLAFLGHTDVVPVIEETLGDWTVDPWRGEVRDGKVYGRGACDMKAGNVAFLWAMKTLSELGVKLGRDVYGAAVIGEETGEHIVGVDQVLDRGYKPEFVLCAEPTNSRICPVGPGIFFFNLIVHGKAIHTSQRYRSVFPQPIAGTAPGVDAVQKTVKFLQGFEDLERQWALRKQHPILPRGASNLTPTLIKGGEYIVALAERCEVTYNVWYDPAEKFEDVEKEIRAYVKRIADNDDWLRDHQPTVELPAPQLPLVMPPIDVPLDHPGCRATADAFETSLGRKATFDAFTAACDLNWLKKKDVTGIILGPGDLSDGTHGVDEFVAVKQVVDCCKVYAATMVNWCGVSEA